MSTETDSPKSTVTCPVCKRPDRTLTKTGKVKQHNDPSKGRSWDPFGVPCAASGKRLDELPA